MSSTSRFAMTVALLSFLLASSLQAQAAEPGSTRAVSPGGAGAANQDSRSRRRYLAQRAESGGTGEGAWQLVKAPMDLPDVPKYTGQAQFVDGLIYPNKPGGAAITLKFRAKETPDVVIGWYRSTLQAYNWKIDPGKTETSVGGSHGNNKVLVNVSPLKSKTFRTEFKVTYKLAN